MSDTLPTVHKEIPKALTDVLNGKKTKTPRNYDSILKGALALELEERVKLKKEIHASIVDEVQAKKIDAEKAAKIAGE